MIVTRMERGEHVAYKGQLKDLGFSIEKSKGESNYCISILRMSREGRSRFLAAQQRNKKQQSQAAIRDTLSGFRSKFFSVTAVKNGNKLPKVM